MKVLYVCSTENLYGDNKALLNLLPYLENFGVRPLFLVRGMSKFYTYLKEKGYTVYFYDGFYAHAMSPDNSLKLYVSWLKTIVVQNVIERNKEFKTLLDILSKENLDLIHTNNGVCTLGYKLAQKMNIPHVWHIREYVDIDANYHFMPSKRTYCIHLDNPINYKIAITDGVKRHFHLRKMTSVIYDGVFLEDKRPTIVNKKEDYFLYVGRLAEGKRVIDAIEAFGKFKRHFMHSQTKLLIAGEGLKEYTQLLSKKAEEYGVIKFVKFLGYRNDVAELMSKARALIVPSQFEAFGFITAEAMFYGCPVIGRNTGGTKEQMDNVESILGKKVCYRFSHNDELTGLLYKLYNENVNSNILKNIQNVVAKKYSSKKSAEKVFDIYKKIIYD